MVIPTGLTPDIVAMAPEVMDSRKMLSAVTGALSGLDRRVGNAIAPTANMYVDRYCHLSLFTRLWLMAFMLMDFEEWNIPVNWGPLENDDIINIAVDAEGPDNASAVAQKWARAIQKGQIQLTSEDINPKWVEVMRAISAGPSVLRTANSLKWRIKGF